MEVILGFVRCSIDIITSTIAKLPIFVNVSNFGVARACVRENASDTMSLGMGSETGFDCKVFMSTSQSSQKVKSWVRLSSLIFDLLVRQEDTKSHLTLCSSTPMFHYLIKSSESLSRRDNLDLRIIFLNRNRIESGERALFP